MARPLMAPLPRWTSLTVLAPDQGAQVIGMGKNWRSRSPRTAQLFNSADDILGDPLGPYLSELIDSSAEDGTKMLESTDIAQPAIFVTSLACWASMLELSLIHI